MALILVGKPLDPEWRQLTTVAGDLLVEGEFHVLPITGATRRKWMREHRFCHICGGIGILPLGDGKTDICPVCRARRDAPSMNDLAVQKAIASQVCIGWRNVPVAGGGEYPFTPENLGQLVEAYPEVFWALIRTAESVAQGQAAESGKG